MNHRQKLVELREELGGLADTVPTYANIQEEVIRLRDEADAILADWPEDAKVMPREASTPRRVFHGSLITGD